MASSSGKTHTVAPFKYKAPLTNINGVGQGQIATIQFPPVFRINAFTVVLTVTRAAPSNGTRAVPLFTDGLSFYQFKVGGNPIRTRNPSAKWGATGINALCDINSGGTVVYTQAGNANLSTIPVLIGSAADVAQQALLNTNTITVAEFNLPEQFAEPFRKEYNMTEALALVQAGSDGTNIGTCTAELTIPAATATVTAVALKAHYEYDTLVKPTVSGGAVSAILEYQFTVPYTATGDLECGQQLYNFNSLNRISLLTAGDNISRVVIKQGSTILRDIYYPRNVAELIRKDYNVNAIISNRFDIEFDENDDPNQAPVMNPTQPLSILATLATNNGANVTVLASYYGPVN